MFWASINTVLAIIVALLIVVKLSRFAELLTAGERIGLGLQGAAAIMAMAVRWDLDGHGTPFDGWSTTLFQLGLLLYLASRLQRHIRHKHANDAAPSVMAASIAARRRGH